jgi:multidrug transporter EmrE-like cation transporter
MYKSEISRAKWIAYALLADVGWLSFFVALLMCFIKTPEILESGSVVTLLITDILGALLMLSGIMELMSEHRQKLSRILSGKQLAYGFGALTVGGALGTLCSVIALAVAVRNIMFGAAYLIALSVGGLLCSLFSGLILKEYRKI